jgi:hypothetical protein
MENDRKAERQISLSDILLAVAVGVMVLIVLGLMLFAFVTSV